MHKSKRNTISHLIAILVVVVLAFSTMLSPAYANSASKNKETSLEKRFAAADIYDEGSCDDYARAVSDMVLSSTVFADKSENFDPRSDQLTAVRGFGTYPTRRGVILVTDDKYKNLFPTGHAGIVASSSTIIDSLADGVKIRANNWNTAHKTCYGVTVGSTTVAQDAQAVDWCGTKTGKPYNYDFSNVSTRSKFYCSQLVWAAFKDKFGIDLNTSAYGAVVHPSELVSTPKTGTIYVK